ncbi:ATP-binding protein [Aestuariivirga sp.]|jgi:signal transduction histidine kinase|uniref:ATP-binding protein n=1 Tax=Aestuariivirga sp. TaxID=2650926 RepID=UPI00378351E9
MTHTTPAQTQDGPRLLRGLSAKLLAMTVVFVMLGEVLIFLPSIANFRIQWLKARVAQAEIAALATEAADGRGLPAALRTEILDGAGVLAIALMRDDKRLSLTRGETSQLPAISHDLRDIGWLPAIADAFGVMLSGGDRVIAVVDAPPNMPGGIIEVVLHEKSLQQAMLRFGINILILSVILSAIVAGLVYATLNLMLLRPIKQIIRNMVSFRTNPEDRSRIITPSARQDEIGMAARELHAMQSELATMLQQKSRLAALGLAAAKVNHDLRNMLSSAQLISDRLALAEDATVKRFAPKLIASLDRAIALLSETLRFGRAEEPPPQREILELRPLVDDLIEAEVLHASPRILLFNDVPAGLMIDAGRDQLLRILNNVLRNAVQALETAIDDGDGKLEGHVRVSARRESSVVTIEIADDGPGIPEQLKPRLFEAFQSAAKQGGVGLGLAIAAELLRAHGGEIRLRDTGPSGTVFQIRIPDRLVSLREGRRGARKAAASG